MHLQQKVITIEDRTPAPPTIRKAAGGKVHLYYFHSPKNGCRFVFCGQLGFYLAILLEGEPCIAGYGARTGIGAPGLSALLRDDRRVEYEVRYLPDGVRPPVIHSLIGATENGRETTTAPLLITDHFLRERQVRIENWIFLCAAMNRARIYSCENEARVLSSMLERFGSASIETLLSKDGVDKSCMLGAIGRAIQAGAVDCDTHDSPITRLTTVSAAGSSK